MNRKRKGPVPAKFKVRFRIGNRLGKGVLYSLREVCLHLVERYSLTERELNELFQLPRGATFSNEDMEIRRRA